MPEPLLIFECCQHCEHTDPHELPHTEVCDHGCNDVEMAEACGWETEDV